MKTILLIVLMSVNLSVQHDRPCTTRIECKAVKADCWTKNRIGCPPGCWMDSGGGFLCDHCPLERGCDSMRLDCEEVTLCKPSPWEPKYTLESITTGDSFIFRDIDDK